MEDWDLQAVVRGCRSAMAVSAPTSTAAVAAEDPLAWFSASLLEEEDDHLLFFPDVLAAQTSMQELEELCKPFYPKTPQPKSPQIHSSMVPVSPSCLKGQQQQQQKNQRPASPHPQISRSKRRKSQQKKVVCEVPAEGLSSDMWAWRKYGQKPIKGSPYPRGYYRCSSLKGCSARKQVERSRTDPSMFIITYTGEHSHPLPTHRNSLAGSTRHKHSNSSSSDHNNKASASSDLSPMEEDPFLQQQQEQEQLKKKVEEGEEGEEEVVEEEKDELMTTMADDLFLDLEELQEPTSSNSCSFSDCFSDPFPWVSSHSATSAASDVR